MLVDGGASANFVGEEFVQANRLRTQRRAREVAVTVANGGQVRCGKVVRRARIEVGEHDGTHDLVVMPRLSKFDAVLGRPFLRDAAATVNHRTARVTWDHSTTPRSQPPAPTLAHVNSFAVLSPDDDPVEEEEGTVTTAPAAPAVSMPHREALALVRKGYEERMAPYAGKLPPSRGQFDHQIVLKNPDQPPVKRKAIPLSAKHQQLMKSTLDELEAASLIERSRSAWAAPVFFTEKGRMVVDYRGLNEAIKRNSTSLPLIKELLARLKHARCFTKIDLKAGYHQVRIRPEDCELTAFITPFGHFHWNVMPFGEGNAPATFVQLMAQLVLKDLIHQYVIAFVDDVLIFSDNEEEHVQHVKAVLDRLEQHRLFLKSSKCVWMASEVEFLGHRIRAGVDGTEILPIAAKVDAVRDWPTPLNLQQLRSFLGLANYYMGFVENFAAIAKPLTDLTKNAGNDERKNRPLARWTGVEEKAFDDVKAALCSAQALGVADESKQFILHTDASDFAIGAVLSQRNDAGKLVPLGYMSRKLSDAECGYGTYDKEALAILEALRHWRMYFVGVQQAVQVHTDHNALRFIAKQKIISPRQIRWLEELRYYWFEIQHIAGTENTAADALSRRPDHDIGAADRRIRISERARQRFCALQENSNLATAATLAVMQLDEPALFEASIRSTELLDEIRTAYKQDEECMRWLDEPERYRLTVRSGLLINSDEQLIIPKSAALRTKLIHEEHDAGTAGHFGSAKTDARLAAKYYWRNRAVDANTYVGSCTYCQASKSRTKRMPGLLQPIEIVPKKGHTITMDFVGPLPRTARHNDFLLVIVDQFTKRAWYCPLSINATAKSVARIVFDRVVRSQGLPRKIISDRDAKFTSDFWQELWTKCGTRLAMSTAYHPESDGLTERQNRTVLDGLRTYSNAKGTDWDLHIGALEIAYNSSVHASTGMTPFLLDGGSEIVRPSDIALAEIRACMNESAGELLERMKDDAALAHQHLVAAQERQRRAANKKRVDVHYQVGDMAWLDSGDLPIQKGPSRKLLPRFVGPFLVTHVYGDVTVRLQLPTDWSISDKFHVRKLKRQPPIDEEQFPGRAQSVQQRPELSANGDSTETGETNSKSTTTRTNNRKAERKLRTRSEKARALAAGEVSIEEINQQLPTHWTKEAARKKEEAMNAPKSTPRRK